MEEAKLFDFLGKVFSGALSLFDSLISGIPVAKEAILWAVFVMLVMNLIIIPIRGAGMSDRALAKDVISGRSVSTNQVKSDRAKSNYLRDRSLKKAHYDDSH